MKSLNGCLLIFTALYAAVLLAAPRFAPNDDFFFLKTLQAGKPILCHSASFPYHDVIEQGRFLPMAAMEYNLAALFSATPFAYFGVHAVQWILFAFAFARLLASFSIGRPLIFGVLAVLVLHPAFVIPWFRLLLGDRNVLFFLILFLLADRRFQSKGGAGPFCTALLCANVAIYYKETAFGMFGAYAGSRLLLFRKRREAPRKGLDVAVLCSAFAYITIYFFHVYLRSPLLYLGSSSAPLYDFVKKVVNYAFFSDPIPFLLFLPVAVFRFVRVVFRGENPHPFLDPMLAGGVALIGAYLCLGYGPYYLLPVYGLAFPPVIRFLPEMMKSVRRRRLLLTGAALFLCANTLPAGLHYLTYHKHLAINFDRTLDFLVSDIRSRKGGEQGEPPALFLYGINRHEGRGVYYVLGDFLEYRGLSPEAFDLRSEEEGIDVPPWSGKTIPPYTLFRSGAASEMRSGDYLIVPPQSTKPVDGALLARLREEYDPLFSTESRFLFPNVNMKSIAKHLILAASPERGASLIVNRNPFSGSDYHVFRKR